MLIFGILTYPGLMAPNFKGRFWPKPAADVPSKNRHTETTTNDLRCICNLPFARLVVAAVGAGGRNSISELPGECKRLVTTTVPHGFRCSRRKLSPVIGLYAQIVRFLVPIVFAFSQCSEERCASANPHNRHRLHGCSTQAKFDRRHLWQPNNGSRTDG